MRVIAATQSSLSIVIALAFTFFYLSASAADLFKVSTNCLRRVEETLN